MLQVFGLFAMSLISQAICGPAYRLRGSVLWLKWTGRGVGTARLVVWGGSIAAVIVLHDLYGWATGFGPSIPEWVAVAAMLGAYAGASLSQWGSIDIGRKEGLKLPKLVRRWQFGAKVQAVLYRPRVARPVDLVLQSVRGACSVAPVALAFWLAGLVWWPIPVFAASSGLVYDIAWRTDPKTRHTELDEPVEAAEVGFGIMVGAGLALAFYLSAV